MKKRDFNAVRTNSGVILPLCGVYDGMQKTTKDGIRFTPAIFYQTASRNIGILVEGPNSGAIAWAEHLYSNPSFAAQYVKDVVSVYDSTLTAEQKADFMLRNGLA